MRKVVLDCNVLISAGINNGLCRQLVQYVLKNHKCFYSEKIEKEYRKTAEKSYLEKYKKGLDKVIQNFLDVAFLVEPDLSSFGLPDSDDEVYIGTALSAKAEIIITGNKKHFPLDEYGGVKILTPRIFLDNIQI